MGSQNQTEAAAISIIILALILTLIITLSVMMSKTYNSGGTGKVCIYGV